MLNSDLEAGEPELIPVAPPRPSVCRRHQHQNCESEMTPKQKADFAVIKFIGGMIAAVMRRFWLMTTAVILGVFVSYWVYGGWLALLLIFCGLTGLVYQISDELVYWPNFPPDSRVLVRLPSAVGLPSENLYLYARDGTKLHAVFIKQDPHAIKAVPTFIYLHGNAGNMGHRLSNIYGLYRCLGINLLMVEYRGYGLSSGNPSEEGLGLDAQAAVSYLRTRSDIDQNKIIVFGRSLGGAVAIDAVSRSEMSSCIAALVVENTFTSIPDMAKVLFANTKVLSSLPLCCHKNKYSSKTKMCRVVVPTLLLSGQADTLVPPRMMLELYQSCPAVLKRLLQFANGSHNETWKCPGYYQALSFFMDEVFRPNRQVPKFPPGVVCVSEPQVL